MRKLTVKAEILAGTAILLCGLHAGPAFAQAVPGSADQGAVQSESTEEAASAPEESIVVTGYRAQNRSAIDAKRDADTIVDGLVADDIGRQPDHNLADSLRRLPGVITEFDEDEGRFVSVRGLPSRYTFISLNGIYIPNGAGSLDRNQNIENIPSYAVKRALVYKALTPELEANAIGGYVESDLHSAFDRRGSQLTGKMVVGHHTYTETPGGQGNPSAEAHARFTTRFGADDQFGIVLAGNYFDKNRDQTKQVNQWRYETNGTPYIYRIDAYDYNNDITRWSALGRLEWKPTSDFYTAFSVSHFSYQQNEERFLLTIEGRGTRVTSPEGGRWQRGRAGIQLDRFPNETKANFYSWESKLDVNDRESISLIASYASSDWKRDDPAQSVNFLTADINGLSFTYDRTAQDERRDRVAPITIVDPSILLDTARYNFSGDFLPSSETQSQTVKQVKLDYANEPDVTGFGFKIGGLAREFTADRDRSRVSVTAVTPSSINAGLFANGTVFNPNLGLDLPLSNIGGFIDFFNANPSRFNINRQNSVVPEGYQNLIADVEYEEMVLAGYAMAMYKGERFKIRGGFRVEHTSYDALSYRQLEIPGDDDIEPVRYARSYTDFLPSVVGSFGLTDNLIFRFGYSKAIGRPDPGDIAQTEQRSENTLTGDINITRGNPDLKPRRSDNYDLSLEYYPAGGVQLSLGYFYKSVKDELFTRRVESFEGDSRVIFTQPVNAGGAKVQGLELSVNYDKFDFLPGFLADFGVLANVTYLDSQFEIETADGIRDINQLLSAPNWQVNLGLLYESGPVEAKLTYAYQDARRQTVDDVNPALDRYETGFDQLDAQIRLSLSKSIQLVVEGRNILNNKRLLVEGLEQDNFREVNQYGASYWAGVSFKF